MDTLSRIKRLIVSGQYRFTEKASLELENNGLAEQDALETTLNARFIKKTIRSTSPYRTQRRETLYVIEGKNFFGTRIYTKGKIVEEVENPYFYVLVSAKRSVFGP